MSVVVDTSIWVCFFAGRPARAVEQALRHSLVVLPPLVLAELVGGVRNHKEALKLLSFLDLLPLCPAPREHWIRVGELRSKCKRNGIAVSTPDAHIAQCALDSEARLLTSDGIFRRIAEVTALQLG